MRKFSINCDFGGQMSPFVVCIGKPEKQHHPLHFQAEWLSKQRGGVIPAEVMDAIAQLKELSEKHGVPLEELCAHALENSTEAGTAEESEAESEISSDEEESEEEDQEQDSKE